jgi:hypothetical protein
LRFPYIISLFCLRQFNDFKSHNCTHDCRPQASLLRRLLIGADAEAVAAVPVELRAAARQRHPCLVTVLGFLVDYDEDESHGNGGVRVRVMMELASLGSLHEVSRPISV